MSIGIDFINFTVVIEYRLKKHTYWREKGVHFTYLGALWEIRPRQSKVCFLVCFSMSVHEGGVHRQILRY
jgi:hypothetical protein